MMTSVFNVREHGAVGDGHALDTDAIQAAIDRCHAAGGGTVYCPPGDYLVGSVEIKGNVNLHIEAGASLCASTDKADYTPVDHGMPEAVNYNPYHLIYARDAENVALTGRGTIDGQGRKFFGPVKQESTYYSVKDWRPFQLVAFFRCRNLNIEDLSLIDAPGWTIWPLGCDKVRIRGITILNDRRGPNTDGIDPDCCRNVHISDCHIEAGDDCIALKSSVDKLPGIHGACENITVTNCTLRSSTCGVRIGYEGDGPIRRCMFSNLVMFDTRTGINVLVPRHAEVGIEHGPIIENISFNNIDMETQQALYLWIGDDAAEPGGIRDFSIAGLRATTERGCYVGGSRSIPIDRVNIRDLDLTVNGEMDDEFGTGVPYPYRVWGYWNKRGIPHALYCRHTTSLTLRDIRVRWRDAMGAWRSALRCENVHDLELAGFTARQAPDSDAAAVHLSDVQGAILRGCRAEPGTGEFLCLDGETTCNIKALGNDVSRAASAFRSEGCNSAAFCETGNLL